MRRCPQPIVCLVQGAASGGGFALALASDIRLCAPDARMNASFIRIGLTGCDMGVSYFLPRMVGSSVASEYLLTGRFMNAQLGPLVQRAQCGGDAVSVMVVMWHATGQTARVRPNAAKSRDECPQRR